MWLCIYCSCGFYGYFLRNNLYRWYCKKVMKSRKLGSNKKRKKKKGD